MARFILGLFLLCVLAPPGAGAQSCTEIRFARGASSAEVTGSAPADGVICYALSTGAGQQARLRVLEGNNTIFTIEGLVDAQNDYSFRTKARTYRILVGQLMRAARDQPFRLHVSVAGGRGAAAGSDGPAWRSMGGGITATSEGRARDGRTRAIFQCRAGGPARATLQLYGEPGPGLPLRDGERAQVTIAIDMRGGTRRFEAVLTRHDGNDQWWDAVDAFGADFLDAFAAGRTMALVDAGGAEVVRFDLSGSADARRAMRAKCGF